jgi:hypothetical protein
MLFALIFLANRVLFFVNNKEGKAWYFITRNYAAKVRFFS